MVDPSRGFKATRVAVISIDAPGVLFILIAAARASIPLPATRGITKVLLVATGFLVTGRPRLEYAGGVLAKAETD